MDPIDFTKPEAFSQVGAGASGEALDLNRQISAPSSAEGFRLRRALRWLLFWIVLISLHGSQLAGAQLRLASCPPELDAAQLGGITPYPGIACTALAQLRDAQGSQTLYVFQLASGSDSAAIYAHFGRWADQHAGSSGSSVSGETHYVLSARTRDEAWRLELDSRQGGATSIMIRRWP